MATEKTGNDDADFFPYCELWSLKSSPAASS